MLIVCNMYYILPIYKLYYLFDLSSQKTLSACRHMWVMILKLKPFSFTIYNLQLYISKSWSLQVNETCIHMYNIQT